MVNNSHFAFYITLLNYAMYCVLAYPRQLIEKTLEEYRCCYFIYLAQDFITELFKTAKVNIISYSHIGKSNSSLLIRIKNENYAKNREHTKVFSVHITVRLKSVKIITFSVACKEKDKFTEPLL